MIYNSPSNPRVRNCQLPPKTRKIHKDQHCILAKLLWRTLNGKKRAIPEDI